MTSMDETDVSDVYLVMSESGGAHVKAMREHGPVWAVGTRDNVDAGSATHGPYSYSFTAIKVDPSLSRQALLSKQIRTLDTHYKLNNYYREVHVIGAYLSDVDFDVFSSCGFDQYFASSDGFTACRSSVPWARKERHNDPKFVVLMLDQPTWFSMGDEDAFFQRLKQIPSIADYAGHEGGQLRVNVRAGQVIANDIRELNALLRRYGLDTSKIQKLVALDPEFEGMRLP